MLRLIITFLFLFLSKLGFSQVTINGYVLDSLSGESLISATVYSEFFRQGTLTNEYGFFSLSLPDTTGKIEISYVGYESKIEEISEQNVIIKLNPTSLEEITISSSKLQVNKRPSLNLPVQVLTSIPTIGAEKDIIKSLSMFPGLSIGQEGTSQLYVRGGTPDQNLILLDGIPVYNATHLGGFFSVFNTEAINNVNVYKSNFPARYGGRLSSIIDISMKEGSDTEYGGKAGIGLLSTHALFNGPIIKEKSNFIITARTSYLGVINFFRKKSELGSYLDYWLYDINAKTTFKTKKGKLFLSYYTGKDFAVSTSKGGSNNGATTERFSSNQNIDWGNTTVSARFISSLSKTMFSKSMIGFTKYHYKGSLFNESYTYFTSDTIYTNTSTSNSSKVNDLIAKFDLEYNPNQFLYLKSGISYTKHNFNVNSSSSNIDPHLSNMENSDELNIYLENDLNFSSGISLNAGLRYAKYFTRSNSFQSIEPRLTLNFAVNKKVNFLLDYSRNKQFLHLLSDNSFGLPVDIWVPVTDHVGPQSADQFSLGIDSKFSQNFDWQVDLYYKKLYSLIEFQEKVDDPFSVIGNWQNLIEKNGSGESYGVEMLFTKKLGKLKGFLGYTLSWTNRKFENINDGIAYPFIYDRRHDISLSANYTYSKKVSFFANWVYQSGIAVTLPVSQIPGPEGQGGIEVFDTKHNGRLPDYHRMDMGMSYTKSLKSGSRLEWNFSLYNSYNRINPSYLLINSKAVFDDDGNYLYSRPKIELFSLFPLIPGASLNYTF